ncbi:MAG: RAD55 family ATPase [Longimicrobiales bacterium]
MIHSGIAPLDQQVGGMSPGRLHLLTGGPGTGKTTACLNFLRAGLDAGDDVVLLTLDRPGDLVAHARCLSLELEPAVRSGQLELLRFKPDFTRALANAVVPDRSIGDLDRLLMGIRYARVVIDPITPFLADSSVSGAVVAALAHWLDRLGATSLLTYPADVSDGYDARLDPIVQRAATIAHLARGNAGTHRMSIVQNRVSAAPLSAISFAWKPDTGLSPLSWRHQAVVDSPPARNGDGPQPLDHESLIRAIAARNTHELPLQYALVILYYPKPSPEALHELAQLAMGRIRLAHGDLAAVLGDRVAVYLHGARLCDTGPFIERVRTQWARKHRGALRIESLAYPADDARLKALLDMAQPA